MIETKAQTDSPFKAYLKKIFVKKQVITKIIILVAAAIIVLVPAGIFYGLWSNNGDGAWIHHGTLINIYVTWNRGIATSAMSGNYAGIYAIQSIVFVLLLAIFWLLTQDKVSCSFVALAIWGGLFNLIQRAAQTGQYANCVFDYIQFAVPWLQWMSLGNTVFNWPDMGVVIGIIGFVISYIAHIIIKYVREKKEEDKVEEKAKAYEKANDGSNGLEMK